MNIAIIPARGGSKRIPKKNIKIFSGKPMISYSIEAAKKSGLFDRIIVSTDSEEIAAVAREYGAEVPFMRPAELSDDYTPTASVIKHAIEWLKNNGDKPDYVCCVYATSPLLQPQYLVDGYNLIFNNQVSSVFSVTTFPFPILRGLKINSDGCLEMFFPEHELTRSNDLPESYHDAGMFYWLETESFLRTSRVYTADAMPVILPRISVQDIDTPEDWDTAEILYKCWQGKF